MIQRSYGNTADPDIVFVTADHPKDDEPGETFFINFPLEDGRVLGIACGRFSMEHLTEMLNKLMRDLRIDDINESY